MRCMRHDSPNVFTKYETYGTRHIHVKNLICQVFETESLWQKQIYECDLSVLKIVWEHTQFYLHTQEFQCRTKIRDSL